MWIFSIKTGKISIYICTCFFYNRISRKANIKRKERCVFMKKIRVGVVGGYRGTGMINYCKAANNAQIVAICDKNPDVLNAQRERCKDYDITYYDNFNDFLGHDMDAVVLANYAHEHAPLAMAALRAGKHVFSEVLPVQTMKEAVELIETVEQTGLVYAYGENYCYMPAPYRMRKLYREGKIGEFEYGECEYIHNCEPIWPSITYGEKDHWRNNMYSTFYCTHSLGPIIHATGLRPVKVTGFEGEMNARNLQVGSKSGLFGIEMVTLENGGIIKSIHGHLYMGSVWYSMYGSKGRMECAREDAQAGHTARLYVNTDEYTGEYASRPVESIDLTPDIDEKAKPFGHGGSDYYSMYNFIEKILGNPEADTIDVYEALDMFLPGMFAYRSILADGVPMDVPNLRNAEEREKWRNDTACTSPEVAGDMLLPTKYGGTPDIPDEVYEAVRQKWLADQVKDDGYRTMVLKQSTVPDKK